MIPLQSKFKGNAALVNRFKTPPFHGGMTGSTPVRGTKKEQLLSCSFFMLNYSSILINHH
jgi:hypothetical protein